MASRSNTRKKRKPRPKKRPQPLASNPAAIAKKATTDLREKNFRLAREGFRRLIKTDPETYTPLYLEAALGYAKELLAAGRLQQVEDVLSRARNLAGESVDAIRLLEIRMAMARGHWTQARELAIALWRGSDEGKSLDAEARLLVADAQILCFDAGAISDHLLVEGTAAVHEALRSLSEGDFTAVDATLRTLGRQSPFAEWKLLIKGLVACHGNDTEQASACFERLCSESVPGRAAKAFLSLTSPKSTAKSRFQSQEMTLMCHLMGHPEAAAYMPSVQEFWESGRLDRAFRLLQEKERAFPSTAPGFWGRLTDLFLYSPPVRRDAYSSLAQRLMKTVYSRDFRHDAEKAALCRWAALDANPAEDPEFYVSAWENFLAAYESFHGPWDRLASRIHARIARGVLKNVAIIHRESAEFEVVLKHLQASLERDEHYCPAYLDLLQIYGDAGMTRERNRLLDKLTKRFPGEKRIILEAARRCVERQSHAKGIAMLRTSLAINPLDHEIIAMMIAALGEQAFVRYKKGDVDQGRACFDEMEPHLVDDVDDLNRGRAYQRVKQCVFEFAYADGGKSEDLAEEAVSVAPQDLVNFTRLLTAAIYYPKDRRWKNRYLRPPEDVFTQPDGANALRMARLLKHHLASLRSERLRHIVSIFQRYLREAIESRQIDPLAARGLVLEQPGFRYELFLPKVVEAALERNPNDLFLQMASYSTEPDEDFEEVLDRFRTLLERAEQTRDRQAIDFGRSKLRELEAAAARDEAFGFFPDDQPAGFSDDEELDEALDKLDEMEENMPGIRFVLEQLTLMTPRERERHRKDFGIPRRQFDQLILIADILRLNGVLSGPDDPPSPPTPPSTPSTPSVPQLRRNAGRRTGRPASVAHHQRTDGRRVGLRRLQRRQSNHHGL